MTYRDAQRMLRLMYDEVLVKRKEFGQVHIELLFDDAKIADLRMLNSGLQRNPTGNATTA